MEKVSLIVPVYNVEKYLSKCIESLINQTYDNIEIILINDGSTDNSETICRKYEKDNNNIVFISQQNAGLSEARNSGIDICTGDYIMFIDSDDYVFPSYVSYHMDLAKKYKADLVISGINNYYEGQKLEEEIININCSQQIVSKEIAVKKMLMQDKIDVSASAKLYERKIFNTLRYPKSQIYEDIAVIDKIVEKSNKIVVTTYSGYNYLQRTGSIMHDKMSDKRMSLIRKSYELLELCEKKYPQAKDAAKKRYIRSNYQILQIAIEDPLYLNISKQLRKNILNNRKFIFESKYVSIKMKIATIVLSVGLKPFEIFWKIIMRQRKELKT